MPRIDMSSKTKTYINNTSCPLVNSFGHMNKNAFKRYKQKTHKALIHSFIITLVIGVIYALISPPNSIIDPFFIAPLFIVFIVMLIVIQLKLNAKYKILNVYRGDSIDSSARRYWRSNNSFNFNDSTNPVYPGTASWISRKHRNEL